MSVTPQKEQPRSNADEILTTETINEAALKKITRTPEYKIFESTECWKDQNNPPSKNLYLIMHFKGYVVIILSHKEVYLKYPSILPPF